MGIEEILAAPKSPWQVSELARLRNGCVERVIGSIRRDCLDHHIILGERHLRRVLKKYLDYYHTDRTHCGIEKEYARYAKPPRNPSAIGTK